MEERDNLSLLSIPLINLKELSAGNLPALSLPDANETNSLGFRLIKGVPSWSPIDLSIVGLSALQYKITVRDLSQFFTQYPNPIAEQWVTCTVLANKQIFIKTIAEWKIISKSNKKVYKLFKKWAPYTFLRV